MHFRCFKCLVSSYVLLLFCLCIMFHDLKRGRNVVANIVWHQSQVRCSAALFVAFRKLYPPPLHFATKQQSLSLQQYRSTSTTWPVCAFVCICVCVCVCECVRLSICVLMFLTCVRTCGMHLHADRARTLWELCPTKILQHPTFIFIPRCLHLSAPHYHHTQHFSTACPSFSHRLLSAVRVSKSSTHSSHTRTQIQTDTHVIHLFRVYII